MSKTALGMAMSRALHRRLARAPVLDDPIAAVFPGVAAHVEWAVNEGASAVTGLAPVMPLARARFFEEVALSEIAHGATQVVVLGAGLDTFAYRHATSLRDVTVFEVDTLGTQRWKVEALAAAGIDTAQARYVEADLAHDDLRERLVAAGFDPTRPSIVSWLGVTYYLAIAVVIATLKTLSGFGRGSSLVVDFFRERDCWDEGMMNGADIARQRGEPWITTFSDREMETLLRDEGYQLLELFTSEDARRRYPTDVPLAANQATVVARARLQ